MFTTLRYVYLKLFSIICQVFFFENEIGKGGRKGVNLGFAAVCKICLKFRPAPLQSDFQF